MLSFRCILVPPIEKIRKVALTKYYLILLTLAGATLKPQARGGWNWWNHPFLMIYWTNRKRSPKGLQVPQIWNHPSSQTLSTSFEMGRRKPSSCAVPGLTQHDTRTQTSNKRTPVAQPLRQNVTNVFRFLAWWPCALLLLNFCYFCLFYRKSRVHATEGIPLPSFRWIWWQ